jgi:TPR repeat protein
MNFNAITNFLIHPLDKHSSAAAEAKETIDSGLAALREGDSSTALSILTVPATAGNAFAQTLMGSICREMVSVPGNYEEAVRWFKLAAEQEYPLAQLQLALMYLHGLGVEKDEAFGQQLLRKASQSGDASAQFELGNFQAKGYLGTPDLTAAAEWYKLAADQNFAPAIKALAAMLTAGGNVPKDVTAALALWDRAADEGDVDALLAMADFHLENASVINDFRPAIRCLEKAAKLGSIKAKSQLAHMYLLGQGVQQNERKAIKLLTEAAEGGDREAALELLEIEEQRKEESAHRAEQAQTQHVPPA